MTSEQKTSGAFRAFKTAFIAGEKSDKAIQAALIQEAAWFHQNSNNTVGFSKICEFMSATSPDSHRTKAIESWLDNVAKLNVSDKGNVTTRKRTKYDEEWMQGLKDVTWYEHARNMQITVPTGNTMNLAGQLVKRAYLGEEPDFEKILNNLKADYSKLRNKPTDKLVSWFDKATQAVKSGDIKRLDVIEEEPSSQAEQAAA